MNQGIFTLDRVVTEADRVLPDQVGAENLFHMQCAEFGHQTDREIPVACSLERPVKPAHAVMHRFAPHGLGAELVMKKLVRGEESWSVERLGAGILIEGFVFDTGHVTVCVDQPHIGTNVEHTCE
ncbi:hypothetical protein BMS3Bbin04_00292 [bacterium BMS3Bbin04]|nr:hypothetical protein BMS3Bbin04_00292 [bacterium BMS3Bbin04]